MSSNHEIAKELAKLASLMAPGGVEDGIGADDSSLVHDNSGRHIEIHNKNFNTHKLGQEMGLGALLPADDWNPPSIAEVEARADAVYGDQSHNRDFYPKGLDAIDELLQGRSPIVASKSRLQKLATQYGEDIQLVLDIAAELSKKASLAAPGIEDSIGAAHNEGPEIQDRIDSNKSLDSVKNLLKGLPIAEVTSYMGPAAHWDPSMDTGGWEGAKAASVDEEPVTRRKQAKLASAQNVEQVSSEEAGSLFGKVASLSAEDQKRFGILVAKGRLSDAEAFLAKKSSQKKTH